MARRVGLREMAKESLAVNDDSHVGKLPAKRVEKESEEVEHANPTSTMLVSKYTRPQISLRSVATLFLVMLPGGVVRLALTRRYQPPTIDPGVSHRISVGDRRGVRLGGSFLAQVGRSPAWVLGRRAATGKYVWYIHHCMKARNFRLVAGLRCFPSDGFRTTLT
jgi:hypothetical protein